MSKTKIVGVLMVIAAISNMGVDLLNGGGFDLSKNFDALMVALNGAGFVFLRAALDKVNLGSVK